MAMAVLANIGMAVQIKVAGQPITKNMLSEVEAKALVANQVTEPGSTSTAGTIVEKLGSLNATGIIQGDPKAILEGVKTGVEIVSAVLGAKGNLGPMLGALSIGLGHLAGAFPLFSLALDILAPGTRGGPDPALDAIKS